ncbi:hypothetical protein A2U01_0056447, partial [Trifolium medium]|nr:hypothetical protein [Trifolium medium]
MIFKKKWKPILTDSLSYSKLRYGGLAEQPLSVTEPAVPEK